MLINLKGIHLSFQSFFFQRMSHETNEKLSSVIILLVFKMLSKRCHLNESKHTNEFIRRQTISRLHDYSMVIQSLWVYNEDQVIVSSNKVQNHESRITRKCIERMEYRRSLPAHRNTLHYLIEEFVQFQRNWPLDHRHQYRE